MKFLSLRESQLKSQRRIRKIKCLTIIKQFVLKKLVIVVDGIKIIVHLIFLKCFRYLSDGMGYLKIWIKIDFFSNP